MSSFATSASAHPELWFLFWVQLDERPFSPPSVYAQWAPQPQAGEWKGGIWAQEVFRQWAGLVKAGLGLFGLSSVSISSFLVEPRSPGFFGIFLLWDPAENLLPAAGIRSGVSSCDCWPKGGSQLHDREDLAHFHHSTLSLSTKTFTSKSSSPLLKSSSFSSFK